MAWRLTGDAQFGNEMDHVRIRVVTFQNVGPRMADTEIHAGAPSPVCDIRKLQRISILDDLRLGCLEDFALTEHRLAGDARFAFMLRIPGGNPRAVLRFDVPVRGNV